LYGISDLRRLGEDTHKFESKYLDGLIGGSFEEVPKVYEKRSPISHVDKIDTPLLVSWIYPFSPPFKLFWSFWECELNVGCVDPPGIRRCSCPTISSRTDLTLMEGEG
jgi:hypothetical protein